MKPLTFTVEQSVGSLFDNPYYTITYIRAKLTTPHPAKIEVKSEILEERYRHHKQEVHSTLLHQLIPQVKALSDRKSLITSMLTSENPNYFKNKSLIDECVKAVEEAISVYDSSNYNIDHH